MKNFFLEHAEFFYRRHIRPRQFMSKNIKRTAFLISACLLILHLASRSAPEIARPPRIRTHQEELVKEAREAAGCRSPKWARGYVVCDRLPYTKVSCGGCKKGCQVIDAVGRHYLIPDVVHFIWFGRTLNISDYHQYLALRSVASIHRPTSIKIYYNSDVIEKSNIWQRIRRDVPCIELIKMEAPERLFDTEILEDLFKADIARLQILKDHGGIYLDLDVITLKSLDPIRIYPAAIGRSKSSKASNGIIFSERNSQFLNMWMKSYRTYDPNQGRSLAFWGLNIPYRIYLHHRGANIVHMDEIRFNRPNPYVDGLDSTTSAHFTLKDNYFLHIHPKAIKGTSYDIDLAAWSEEELRTLDSTYGQAARIALFGTPDLVYREGEFFREPYPKRTVKPFPKDVPGT